MTDGLEEYKLNGLWDLWYHSIEDNNWSNDSYKFLYKIRNLYDIKFLFDSKLQDYFFQNFEYHFLNFLILLCQYIFLQYNH